MLRCSNCISGSRMPLWRKYFCADISEIGDHIRFLRRPGLYPLQSTQLNPAADICYSIMILCFLGHHPAYDASFWPLVLLCHNRPGGRGIPNLSQSMANPGRPHPSKVSRLCFTLLLYAIKGLVQPICRINRFGGYTVRTAIIFVTSQPATGCIQPPLTSYYNNSRSNIRYKCRRNIYHHP